MANSGDLACVAGCFRYTNCHDKADMPVELRRKGGEWVKTIVKLTRANVLALDPELQLLRRTCDVPTHKVNI